MHPASSGVIRAASPSALTSAALAAAVAAARNAERIRAACAAVDAASADATRALRALISAPRRTAKVREALAAAEAAEAAAERVAEATAAALGREHAEDRERATLADLARHTFADRLAALALGPSWTGSGYASALADATRALTDARSVDVPALGAETPDAALAHVVVGWPSWASGEAYSFHVVARTPSRGTFDAYAVYLPEVRGWGADERTRRDVELNLTATRLTADDARALAEAANVAASVVAVVARYAAAHPTRDAMDEAREVLASAYATAYGEPLPERA